MSSHQQRRQIIKSAKAHGWTLQSDALDAIEAHLLQQQDEGHDPDTLSRLFDSVQSDLRKRGETCKTLKASHLEFLSQASNSNSQNKSLHKQSSQRDSRQTLSSPSNLHVVSAYNQPKLVYHETRKRFSLEQDKVYSILGTAQDKVSTNKCMFRVCVTLIVCRLVQCTISLVVLHYRLFLVF
jgi:hypothetical protein